MHKVAANDDKYNCINVRVFQLYTLHSKVDVPIRGQVV